MVEGEGLKIIQGNGRMVLKFGERYKTTDSRKQMKPKGIHTAHHTQTSENQRQRYKSTERNDILSMGEKLK